MAMPSSLQIFPVPENSVNCRLVFSETDSLCYHIHIATADLYWDLAAIKDHLDTSNYPKASENDVMIALYSPRNAKVLGKFKDECNGTAPLEFVGLRAKMYSLQISRRQTKTTTKGIKKSFIKKHVTHQMFLHTLRNKTCTKARFLNFRSRNRTIQTEEVNKICLSAFDDKRYIGMDGVSSLAYGHYRIASRDFVLCHVHFNIAITNVCYYRNVFVSYIVRFHVAIFSNNLL